MSVVVVLAAHGAPPTDYPPKRVGMLMALEFAGKIVERVGFLRASCMRGPMIKNASRNSTRIN